jgi:cystathionine beta-lyase/cystathionine gamma-synthase
LEAAAIFADLPEDTAVVLTETISNPLLGVADIPRLAAAAHRVGAKLVVDNTFATPYHCRPLALGADLSIHSATKFLSGHSDLVAGVASGTAGVIAPIRAAIKTFGATLGPFEAWLALRGLRTLHLRMARHAENALAVARFLEAQPAVGAVRYPGLPSHPHHAIAREILMHGCSGMVSFELAGGQPAVERFLERFRLIRFAASLGDVSTTVSHPATTSHRGLSAEARRAAGIGGGLLRLSVGIEAAGDIVVDLGRGLAAAT